jgi:acyl-CoA reductase-like NAD-dependent aldehyde dehydrogenase
MIAFTGSTRVGKHIMRLAADTLKKVNLETSGIDPFIICEDADLEIAARGAVWARYLNAGQVCTSAKRFYVVDGHRRSLRRALRRALARDRRRRSAAAETDMGPVISSAALARVNRLRSSGGRRRARDCWRAAAGRAGLARGHFLEPTVLDRVSTGARRRARRCSARWPRSCACATWPRPSRSPTTATTASGPTSTRTTSVT